MKKKNYSLTDIKIDEVSLVDKGAVGVSYLLLKRNREGEAVADVKDVKKDDGSLELEVGDWAQPVLTTLQEWEGDGDMTRFVAKLIGDNDELKKSLAEEWGFVEEKDEEDPLKKDLESVPESVRKELEANRAETARLKKEVEDERQLRKDAELRKEAEQYGKLPFSVDDRIHLMRLIGTDEIGLKLLKGANETYGTITKQIGVSGSEDENDETALGRLEKLAKAIQAEEKVTREKAFQLAVDRNPDLSRSLYSAQN